MTLDKGFVPAVNQMLARASGDKYSDIEALVAKAGSVDKLKREHAKELKHARMSARAASDDPRWPDRTVTYKLAHEVLPMEQGSEQEKALHNKVMNFEVPVFEWATPHPKVPEKDDNYIFNSRKLVVLLDALKHGDNVWIHGHTGSGKTTFVEQVAARLYWPVMRINGDSEISRLDLVGREHLTQKDGTTISTFVDGMLPQALTQGCLLLLDEFDATRPDIIYCLNPVTEGSGLTIPEAAGRHVAPDPYFRVVACCNSKGQGDEYGVYGAVRAHSAATLGRFPVWLHHDYLPMESEIALLVDKTGIDDAIARNWVRFAQEMRDSFLRGHIITVISPRELISACERYQRYLALLDNADEAHKLVADTVIVERATDTDRTVIEEILQRVFG